MRIDKIYIEEFKNLIDFTIDLDETKMHTVLLGQNAAGKSNLLEAIVIIFRDLDLEDETSFNYVIDYKCKENLLKVKGGPDTKGKYQFYKGVKLKSKILYNLKPISKTLIRNNKGNYLPKHVFSYYSGNSNRLLEHFYKHQLRFADALIAGKNESIRKLFYVRLIHSQFVMMVFFAFAQKEVTDFLEKYLNIVEFESVLFVFKEPNWARNKNPLDFWGARGLVREFMKDLFEISMAPIINKEIIKLDYRKIHSQNNLYLYISNKQKLRNLTIKYGSNQEFFKMLESTDVSDLIHEVKVKVKKKNADGTLAFKELSEGEQQLLTVLGLLRFTKEDESLILLDEPDTHLNPLWKWQYINLLEDIIKEEDKSQILMTTHDPLVIGGLTKEEIRIFNSRKAIDKNGKEFTKIETFQPDFDPKGIGVAGILTSEFFNLPSTLDEDTLDDIIERNKLVTKQETDGLNNEEKKDLNDLFHKLSELGINTTDRDPFYQKFIIALNKRKDFNIKDSTPQARKKQDEIAMDILDKLFKEQGE